MGQDDVTDARQLLASAGFDGVSEEGFRLLLSALRPSRLRAGEPLFREAKGAHAFHLLTAGELHAVDHKDRDTVVRIIRPGEALDELQVLAGVANSVAIVGAVDSTVASIHEDVLDSLADRHADIRRAIDRLHRRQLLSRLHTVLGTFDREFLDVVEEMASWVHLPRGQLLFEQFNVTEAIYLVVTGRLRVSIIAPDGVTTVAGDCCRGELVGELAFFGVQRRQERVHAVRDSIVVGFSRAEFESLVARRPEILRRVTRTLAERLQRVPMIGSAAGGVTNIALIAISPGVELHQFASRLAAKLAPLGRTLHLTGAGVADQIDEPGISEAWAGSDAEARLLAWLESREASHRFVVYEADREVSLWTRRCMRQADRVILVADSAADPAIGEVENALSELEGQFEDERRLLALVHPNGNCMPSGTAQWLDARRISEHYHVRWNVEQDFGRIARVLAGRAIGIVLGGGGARGFAHIGILRALEEAGVPVDMIGGTSMGAAVAAQYAMGWTSDQLARMFRRVYIDIKPQTEYTLPFLSLVGTGKAEMCGVMVFADVAIEDCWIPYFCISSSLSTAQMVVHRRGLLRKVTLASASLPGFVPPVLDGRELLVDGGLLNNVPTDVMRQLGAGVVMASEVSVEADATFMSDRIPTTWELFREKFWRRSTAPRFPGLVELAVRASMLHSTSRQNAAVEDADFCFRPPIDQFGVVDFLKLDDIVRTGYEYAATVMPDLRSNPNFQPLIQE